MHQTLETPVIYQKLPQHTLHEAVSITIYCIYNTPLTLKYKIYIKSLIMFTLNDGLAADAATKFEHSTTKSAPKI